MTTASTYGQSLHTVGLPDADRVGRKAAVLGELLNAGFTVPEGYVMPAAALEETLLHAGLDDSRDEVTAERVTRAELPQRVRADLYRIADAMAGQALAVRSSGVAEDTAGASYAGQYQTVLNVRGSAGLADAVRTCWASAFAERVRQYAGRQDGGAAGGMPVLVQRMVDATAAGVAFSVNPVTGSDEVRINAVPGLGDRLVDGGETPDEWAVSGDTATHTSGERGAIDAEQAREVARLARRVHAHFGAPQDIEWAFDGERLWLLQARPITALPDHVEPVPIPVDVPDGYWARSTYSSRPLSPMFRSMVLATLDEATSRLFRFGLGECIQFREIGGWVYARYVSVSGAEAVKDRLARVVAEVRAGEPARVFDRWYEEWQPALAARLGALRDTDRQGLDDQSLAGHLRETEETRHHASDVHYRIGGAGTFVLGELGVVCRDLLGQNTSETLKLLTGLPGKTTEPTYALAALTHTARDTPGLAKVLMEADEGTVDQLASVDTDFARGFDAYRREYAHRTLEMDLTSPTMAERPHLLLALVRDQLTRCFDPESEVAALTRQREEATVAARAVLEGDPDALRRFDRVLALAQRAYPLRDDSAYYTQVAGAVLRYAVLEVGRRLAGRGQLDAADHVFFLERDEALAALRDGDDRRPLVARRRGEYAWAETSPGPASYGDPVGPDRPNPRWMAKLPQEARHVLDIGLWSWREVSGEGAHGGIDRQTGVIRGIAGSAGRFTGPARVIRSEAEFGKLRPGDVLVCPETTAQWSVLFTSVGALVTDTGGLLSHPAIIAREYRVPAVLATGNGTSLVRDGQIVTVDGTAGTVQVSR
ncbi:PEP/pyruvate-binding domain-containing protein [Streptomyces canus]|uniref:PEP/pyruvate-binding domain-containing protein n=1 Tax=Streptomyces canus TaxID=58343 RepID=UPI002783FDE5|nr:PEP/pyruvate-binding domain-containing protein [Streptomyces canus]MDQ0762618.1 phosphohistidine swiveling domain-containing protein [Streptomyces canus]